MTRRFEMEVKFPDSERLEYAVIDDEKVFLKFRDGRVSSLGIDDISTVVTEVDKHRRMSELANQEAA